MKKLIYMFLLGGLSMSLFAQEEMTSTEAEKPAKEASKYLPAAGDIAIGVDALPYINFVGNMFSGHDSRNNLNLGNTTIYGKYYLSSDAAVRVELHLNNTTNYDVKYLQDDAGIATNPNAQVEDSRTIKNNTVGIGTGYQMYRGYNRLRGTYGAVAAYRRTNSSTEYQWGNQMTALNTNPTSTTSWGGTGTNNPATRTLTTTNGLDQTISVGLIGGIEFFLAPKVCIGGEFGIYYGYSWYGQTHSTTETMELGVRQEREFVSEGAPSGFDTSIRTNVYDASRVAGTLYFLFHF